MIVLELLQELAGRCLADAECHVCSWVCLHSLVESSLNLNHLMLKPPMQVVYLSVNSFSSYIADDKLDVKCW